MGGGAAAARGLVQGGDMRAMSPFITISAQRCLVVAILLLGGVAQLAGATPALAASLVDLPAGHWAYQSVNELITAGLIPGYTESSFRPGRTITRFEMAILLTRLLAQLDVKAGGDRNEVLESTGLNLAAAAKKVELSQLLATYERHGGLGREAHPKLTPELKSAMKRLFAEFGPELGVLGYEVSQESIPGSVSEKDGILQLALKAIEFFRIRGESLIRLQSVSGEGSPRVEVSRGLPGGAAASWDSGSEQPHRLQLSGVVAGGLMVDASLETTQSGFGDVDIVSFSEAYGAREVPVKLSLGALYLGAGNRVITRFGELPETTLSEFSFYRQQGLQGVQAVVELGNIGSTVIMARRSQKGLSASDSGEFVAVLDGTIQLSDTTTLAATLVSTLPPAGGAPGAWLNPSSTVASVGGTFVASPLLTLSGEYAQNASGLPGGSAVRVGAAMKLGDVQVGAQYRTVQPGFKASLGKDEPGDSLGVGLTVKVGDVVVTTQRDQSWKDLANKLETSTSVGFRYDVA
ncbi:MAG: S-layer homology domain-containing protein, partial [Firmicutes bacterium]|nr:S-layer homology domain-containing protein [Bacillota bacterium]